MDLLSTLGLDGALPEQSTRLTSHPGVIEALNSRDDVRLGFNSCLHCGIQLRDDNGGAKCKACKRVRYCSASCRKADAEEVPSSSSSSHQVQSDVYGDGVPSDAAGHSPVICALLNLCNDDEDAEEELLQRTNKTTSSNNKKQTRTTDAKTEAARYRIRTELESYPATLFNVLSEGPDWFVEAITARLRCSESVLSPEPTRKQQRRGKRDRTSLSPAKDHQQRKQSTSSEGGERRELVLHIVGASADSELWNWDGAIPNSSEEEEEEDDGEGGSMSVFNGYAEACTNLTSYLQNLLEITSVSIRCVFVGPDCPKAKSSLSSSYSPPAIRVMVPIPDSTKSSLTFEVHRCSYGGKAQPYLPKPDAIVFFNPGFSCTDYDWSAALNAAAAYEAQRSSATATRGHQTPFLVTTNTEMEGYADVKALLDGGHVDGGSVPDGVLEAVGHPSNSKGGGSGSCADDDDGGLEGGAFFFFGENPYAGLRVRQSGTMGNDLYVKNRWMLGGLFSSGKTRVANVGADRAPSRKRKSSTMETDNGSDGVEYSSKRHRNDERGGGGKMKNSKRKNPALI